jgi:hypothetical protein
MKGEEYRSDSAFILDSSPVACQAEEQRSLIVLKADSLEVGTHQERVPLSD